MPDPIIHDGITILGKLPDEPDQVPVSPPSGFIWAIGGTWHGKHFSYGIADFRVSVGSKTIDFVMTLDDARALRQLLDQIIENMDEDDDVMPEADDA